MSDLVVFSTGKAAKDIPGQVLGWVWGFKIGEETQTSNHQFGVFQASTQKHRKYFHFTHKFSTLCSVANLLSQC
jgi:hypothetical protein